jgi:NADH dehydrogenase FAD-containing subunit
MICCGGVADMQPGGSEEENQELKHVVIVGGGFAGLNCAKKLAKHPNVRVTLIDRNNYQQFQPLLYQVAQQYCLQSARRAT